MTSNNSWLQDAKEKYYASKNNPTADNVSRAKGQYYLNKYEELGKQISDSVNKLNINSYVSKENATKDQSAIDQLIYDRNKIAKHIINNYSAYGMTDEGLAQFKESHISNASAQDKISSYTKDRLNYYGQFKDETDYNTQKKNAGYYDKYKNYSVAELAELISKTPEGSEEYDFLTELRGNKLYDEYSKFTDEQMAEIEAEYNKYYDANGRYQMLERKALNPHMSKITDAELRELEGMRARKREFESKYDYKLIEQVRAQDKAQKEYVLPYLEKPDFNSNSSAIKVYGDKDFSFDDAVKYLAALPLFAWDTNFTRAINAATDDEKKVFAYIFNTQGQEAAKEWYENLRPTLQYRASAKTQQEWKDFANENWFNAVLTQIAARGTNIIKGGVAVSDIISNIAGVEIDPYDSAHTLVQFAPVVTQEVTKNWGPFGSYAYQLGMGMVDFGAQLLLSKGVGKAAGLSSAATSNIALGIMGTGAAADTITTAKLSGASDSQAIALGAMSGIIEVLCEKASIETLFGSSKGKLSYFLKNAFTEASEEGISSVANIITDMIIMSDKSEVETLAQKYLEGFTDSKGVYHKASTKAEALAMAITSKAPDVLLDALGGFISGGVLGGISLVSSSISANKAANNIINKNNTQGLIDLGLEMPKDSVAYDTTLSLKEQLEATTADKAKKTVAKLYDSIRQEIGDVVSKYESNKDAAAYTDYNRALNQYETLNNLVKSTDNIVAPNQEATQNIATDIENNAEISAENDLTANVETVAADIKSTTEGKNEGVNETVTKPSGEQTGTNGDMGVAQATKKAPKKNANKGIWTEGDMTPKQRDYMDNLVRKMGGVDTSLTEGQNYAKAVGKALGRNVYFKKMIGDGYIEEETGDIYISKNNTNPLNFVLKHELVHFSERNTFKYQDFQDAIIKSEVFAEWLKEKGYDSLKEYEAHIEDLYKKAEEERKKKAPNQKPIVLGKGGATKEIIANFVGERLFTEDGSTLEKLINGLNSSEKQTVLSWFKNFIEYLKSKFTTSSDKRMANDIKRFEDMFIEIYNKAQNDFQNKNTPAAEGGVKYLVKKDANGNKVVYITDDTLDMSNGESIAKTIQKVISKKFNNLIFVNGQFFRINATTNREFRESDWAKALRKEHPEWYSDKLKTIPFADEIISSAKNWINRKPKHPRNDKITSFGHGEVLFKVGNKGYSAEIIIGLKDDGSAILYDLINISSKKIVDAGNGGKGQALSSEATSTSHTIPYTEENVNREIENSGVSVDVETDSANPTSYSIASWEKSEYVQQRQEAAQKIADAIGVSKKKALKYIDDINSIARVIANDVDRLDYDAAPNRKAFVSNVEYGGSIDMSTLCQKRKWLTGTFSAIQRALKDTALTASEILEIRNMLKEKGIEVSCGLCYVEGSRAQMGIFAEKFIERYKKSNPKWIPNMADVNTPEGVENMRVNHPEAYEKYEQFWNNKGVLNEGDSVLFASQQKPKLYQVRTDYKHEILDKFKSEGNVKEKNNNGGLRIQSFSDFEIVHLIDMMQVIIDMSQVGLAGQAYTKVPEFALALGNTGLKINLSLIAKGVDENGNLVFDDVEGMPFDTAMRIRNMYSKNVGTILVVFNDAQLKAALSDNRIDFIIPFHRSQWKRSQYESLGLPANTKDYTYQQNEKYINPIYYTTRNGTIGKRKATNYMPNEYWDFNKSGKENAESYLKMCAENNKRPKFYKLLVDNHDGSYSLQPDGSTDGYWKLLIDFKMYDNNGKGSPQTPVVPNFNMEESMKMLNEYEGGHQSFPADQEVVDAFVSKYKQKHKMDEFDGGQIKVDIKSKTNDYNFTYSVPEAQDGREAELQKLYRSGDITQEEYELLINKRRENTTPGEIIKTPKGEADTTPELARRTGRARGDGESKFYDSIQDSNILSDAFKEEAKSNDFIKRYERIANKETMRDAANALDTGGRKYVNSWFAKKPTQFSAEDVCVGFILLDRYQKVKDYDSASAVAEKLREAGTVSGQTVQAFSILGRFTPEMMIAYAKRDLDSAYKAMIEGKSAEWVKRNKEKFKLTEDEQNFIRRKMVQASELPEGRDKNIRIAEINAMLQNKLPAEKGQAYKALQRISMLLNPKTNVRNVLGNALMVPIHLVDDFISTGVDTLVSKKTGFRTIGAPINVKENVKAFAQGAYESWDDFRRRISTRDVEMDRFDIGQGKSFREDYNFEARNKLGKALNALDRTTSFLLEFGDRPFFQMWFINSLNNQMRINKASEATAEMIEIATQEALERTWQDTNSFTKAVTGIKNGLNKITGEEFYNTFGYGLGDLFIKFTKTPANLTKAMVEFSPVGLVKALSLDAISFSKAVKTGQLTAAKQRKFVNNISKGITGTLLYVLFSALARAGITQGSGDEDKDVAAFEKNVLGIQPYSIKIGNSSFSYEWAQPIGAIMAITADIYQNGEGAKGEKQEWYNNILDAFKSGGKVLFNQSFMKGIQNFFEEDGFVTAMIDGALDEPAIFIPQFVSQTAGLFDDTSRTSFVYDDSLKSSLYGVLSKIPGARNVLPAQFDVFGRDVKNPYQMPWNAYLNPANPRTDNSTPVSKELYEVYKQTGDKSVIPAVAPYYLTINDEKKVFTTEERQKYQQLTGGESAKQINNLLDDPAYKMLKADIKAEVIKDIYAYNTAQAKEELFGKELTSAQKKIEKYAEMGLDPEIYILVKTLQDGTSKASYEKAVDSVELDPYTKKLLLALNDAEGKKNEDALVKEAFKNYNK